MKLRHTVIALLLLIAQGSLLAYLGAVCSCAYNEEGHLASGIVNLHTGNFSAFSVNPPLARLVAALPLSFVDSDPFEPYSVGNCMQMWQRQEYSVGRLFLEENRDCWTRYLRIGRASYAVFGLAGSIFCWYWASQWYGGTAGLVAMVLWMSCPFVLGHGSIIGCDLPGAAVGVAAVYCYWRWLKKPQWLETVITGLVLGLAQLCKFTLLVLYPLVVVLWVAYRLPEWRIATRLGWLPQGGMLVVMLSLSMCAINCGYLFEGTCTPLEEFRFHTMLFTGYKSLDDLPPEGANRFAGMWLGKVPVPMPVNMVRGIDTQRYDFERGLPSYSRGQWRDHGWWYYYLYALAIKVPLGTWSLAVLAIIATILRWGYSLSWRDEMILLAPFCAILVVVSSQTGFSVHSRYVIPALPFLFIWTSKIARAFERCQCAGRGLVVVAMVVIALTWSVGSSLAIYPHSLSYFNELAAVLPTPAVVLYPRPIGYSNEDHSALLKLTNAGPRSGPRHLLDSNIDWGQDLFFFRNWLDKHTDVKLNGLAVWGSYPPSLAGIPNAPTPPVGMPGTIAESDLAEEQAAAEFGPKPGWYALSVNRIYGRDRHYCYFLYFRPAAMAGYSIYIYNITIDEANRVRRELGLSELKGGGKEREAK